MSTTEDLSVALHYSRSEVPPLLLHMHVCEVVCMCVCVWMYE